VTARVRVGAGLLLGLASGIGALLIVSSPPTYPSWIAHLAALEFSLAICRRRRARHRPCCGGEHARHRRDAPDRGARARGRRDTGPRRGSPVSGAARAFLDGRVPSRPSHRAAFTPRRDPRLAPACAVDDSPVSAVVSVYGPADLAWGLRPSRAPRSRPGAARPRALPRRSALRGAGRVPSRVAHRLGGPSSAAHAARPRHRDRLVWSRIRGGWLVPCARRVARSRSSRSRSPTMASTRTRAASRTSSPRWLSCSSSPTREARSRRAAATREVRHRGGRRRSPRAIPAWRGNGPRPGRPLGGRGPSNGSRRSSRAWRPNPPPPASWGP